MLLTRKGLFLLMGSAVVVVAAVMAGVLIGGNRKQARDGSSVSGLETEAASISTVSPSASPTISQEPTLAPSDGPSGTPSFLPSTQPSAFPTDGPSGTPSFLPTTQPSAFPTTSPSTLAPTFTPITRRFRLKMHWEDDYFWQEDERERQYCMACAKCDELNFSEQSRDEYGCTSADCETDDQLWIRECDDGHGAEFRAETHPDGIMVRVSETSVCMTRTGNRFISLQSCDEDNERQKWQHFGEDLPFPLSPVYSDYSDHCISQHHHPKSYEMLGLKPCEEAHDVDTGLWDVFELD